VYGRRAGAARTSVSIPLRASLKETGGNPVAYVLVHCAELKSAGKAIPISGSSSCPRPSSTLTADDLPHAEMLKAHRVYDLYHAYDLYNVEFSVPELEESYKDQLLCSWVSSPSCRARTELTWHGCAQTERL
jgi:hypothetical protein